MKKRAKALCWNLLDWLHTVREKSLAVAKLLKIVNSVFLFILPPKLKPLWRKAAQVVRWGRFISSDLTGIPLYTSAYEDNMDFSGRQTDVRAIAYYLPQFHTFPENDMWWGKGFTEWANTTACRPRFPGHYQPRTPHEDIGYYDLSNVETLKKQVQLANQHGVYGLCFYYYWFSGKRLMEKPLDMLLEHSEIDTHFCLCWANESWSRAWDGENKQLLIKQEYHDEDCERFLLDIKKYFADPRYIRIDGKPVLLVYRMGEIPHRKQWLKALRQHARKAGVGEILIWACRTRGHNAESLGIEKRVDAEVEFPPHNVVAQLASVDIAPEYRDAKIYSYHDLVRRVPESYAGDEPSRKIYRTCMMAWDNAARRKFNFNAFVQYSTQDLYAWLTAGIQDARERFAPEERFIFINAWNEWAEGTYLEPDEKYGYSNINTLSRALFGIPLGE